MDEREYEYEFLSFLEDARDFLLIAVAIICCYGALVGIFS